MSLLYEEDEFQHICYPGTRLQQRPLLRLRMDSDSRLSSMYEFGNELGRGTFGVVVRGRAKETGIVWAIKIIHKVQSHMKLLDREINILRVVNHPNIIYLERVFETPKRVYMVFELCTGPLAQEFKRRGRFPECDTRTVIHNLSSAVAYLHRLGIVHRDLKLENILLAANPKDATDHLFIKVTDFGLSVVLRGHRYDQMLRDRCGTVTYMAPEVIESRTYSQLCDVWSMGVIMFVLLSGDFPFFANNYEDLRKMILTKDPDYSKIDLSPGALSVLQGMLRKSPEYRRTAAEIHDHPWVVNDPCRMESSNILDKMTSMMNEMRNGSTISYSSTLYEDPDIVRTSIRSRKHSDNGVRSETPPNPQDKEMKKQAPLEPQSVETRASKRPAIAQRPRVPKREFSKPQAVETAAERRTAATQTSEAIYDSRRQDKELSKPALPTPQPAASMAEKQSAAAQTPMVPKRELQEPHPMETASERPNAPRQAPVPICDTRRQDKELSKQALPGPQPAESTAEKRPAVMQTPMESSEKVPKRELPELQPVETAAERQPVAMHTPVYHYGSSAAKLSKLLHPGIHGAARKLQPPQPVVAAGPFRQLQPFPKVNIHQQKGQKGKKNEKAQHNLPLDVALVSKTELSPQSQTTEPINNPEDEAPLQVNSLEEVRVEDWGFERNVPRVRKEFRGDVRHRRRT